MSLFRSFGFALSGILHALLLERNFRFQWLCGLVVLMIVNIVSFADWQNVVIIILTALVLAFELLNSAIEKVCDSSGLEYAPLKKLAKDFAAAAVLIIAMAAALIFLSFLASTFSTMTDSVSLHAWPFLSIAIIFFLSLPCALTSSPNFFHAAFFAIGLVIHGMLVANHHEHLILASGVMAFHGIWALALMRQIFSLKKLATKARA